MSRMDEPRVLLTGQGLEYIFKRFTPAAEQSGPDDVGSETYVLYDTSDLLLDRVDHILASRDDTWTLTLPTNGGRETIDDAAAIIKRIDELAASWQDQTQAAEIDRIRSKTKSLKPDPALGPLGDMCLKYSLKALAQLRSQRLCFKVPATGRLLDLEILYATTKHAEPAAVSCRAARLARSSDGQKEETPLATFCTLRREAEGVARTPELHSLLLQQVMSDNFLDDATGGCRPGSSALVEYLRLYRPYHLSNLTKAGISFPAKTLPVPNLRQAADAARSPSIDSFQAVSDLKESLPGHPRPPVVPGGASTRSWHDTDGGSMPSSREHQDLTDVDATEDPGLQLTEKFEGGCCRLTDGSAGTTVVVQACGGARTVEEQLTRREEGHRLGFLGALCCYG